jgi:hypothetical protein
LFKWITITYLNRPCGLVLQLIWNPYIKNWL